MTVYWLSAGCLACAIAGFSLVRVVARVLSQAPATRASAVPLAASTREVSPAFPREVSPAFPREVAPAFPALVEEAPRPAAAVAAPRPPAPTAPQPAHEKLKLWAEQVRAGERKMSVATDGCRVTWNRTCKHGHPTWLVQLGYLSPPQPAERISS